MDSGRSTYCDVNREGPASPGAVSLELERRVPFERVLHPVLLHASLITHERTWNDYLDIQRESVPSQHLIL